MIRPGFTTGCPTCSLRFGSHETGRLWARGIAEQEIIGVKTDRSKQDGPDCAMQFRFPALGWAMSADFCDLCGTMYVFSCHSIPREPANVAGPSGVAVADVPLPQCPTPGEAYTRPCGDDDVQREIDILNRHAEKVAEMSEVASYLDKDAPKRTNLDEAPVFRVRSVPGLEGQAGFISPGDVIPHTKAELDRHAGGDCPTCEAYMALDRLSKHLEEVTEVREVPLGPRPEFITGIQVVPVDKTPWPVRFTGIEEVPPKPEPTGSYRYWKFDHEAWKRAWEEAKEKGDVEAMARVVRDGDGYVDEALRAPIGQGYRETARQVIGATVCGSQGR